MKTILMAIVLVLVGCAGTPKKVETSTPTTPASSNTTATETKKEENKSSTPTPPASAPTTKNETPEAKAEQTSATSSGSVVKCTLKDDERILENVKAATGCELKYTKYKEMTVIASSSRSSLHCDQVGQKIQANLEKAGFHCE